MKSFPFLLFSLIFATHSFAGPWGASVKLEMESRAREGKAKRLQASSEFLGGKDIAEGIKRLKVSINDLRLELLAMQQILKIDASDLEDQKRSIVGAHQNLRP